MGLKSGVLLVNLGTPDAPETTPVRRYLAEFLSDPRVLDIHPWARWLLLHLVILRTRPAQSAAAYRKVWMAEGSPLLVHSRALERGVRDLLAPQGVPAELAMRYGSPSIAAGLDRLSQAGCDRLVVLPLYPQYASSSTGSTLERVYRELAGRWNTPYVSVVPPFYDDAGFLAAFADVGRECLPGFGADHLLFSFHGLPERHIRKSEDPPEHDCVRERCTTVVGFKNRNCYRAQCYFTARALASALEWPQDRYSVAFQSRLGRDPWIQPFTDLVLPELARKGVRRVAVYCPAFVADCLETLEEIGIRAKEDFLAHGGEDLMLIPSLNARPSWIAAVARLAQTALGEEPAATRAEDPAMARVDGTRPLPLG